MGGRYREWGHFLLWVEWCKETVTCSMWRCTEARSPSASFDLGRSLRRSRYISFGDARCHYCMHCTNWALLTAHWGVGQEGWHEDQVTVLKVWLALSWSWSFLTRLSATPLRLAQVDRFFWQSMCHDPKPSQCKYRPIFLVFLQRVTSFCGRSLVSVFHCRENVTHNNIDNMS